MILINKYIVKNNTHIKHDPLKIHICISAHPRPFSSQCFSSITTDQLLEIYIYINYLLNINHVLIWKHYRYYKVWNIYVDMIQVNKYAKNMQNKLDPYGSTYGIRHINHSSPKTYCQLQWIRSYIYIKKI
jgi:hypothetical protein